MSGILVLNGPNLNLLGKREPEIYGYETLDDIMQQLEVQADDENVRFEAFQSNAEHELVNRIQACMTDGTEFIIINPAAFTHTSVAIRDALAATKVSFIEVHLSNIHQREDFRKHSYFSDLALGVIAGLGSKGYELALNAALEHIAKN